MAFLNKSQLKKQLQEMGVNVEGNYVKRSDITKVFSNEQETSSNLDPEVQKALEEVEKYLKKLISLRHEGKDLAKKYESLKGDFIAVGTDGLLISEEDNFGDAFWNSLEGFALLDNLYSFIEKVRESED